MSLLYDDVQMDQETGRNTKVLKIYVVIIKISMTGYHHWINGQTYHLFYHSSLWGEMSKINPVTCLFHLFEALNNAFEMQLFQGFIFTPYRM